jgi:hypothetical protein
MKDAVAAGTRFENSAMCHCGNVKNNDPSLIEPVAA